MCITLAAVDTLGSPEKLYGYIFQIFYSYPTIKLLKFCVPNIFIYVHLCQTQKTFILRIY